MRTAALLLLLGATSCAGVLTKTDAAFVGDRLAARIYYEDKVEQLCPHDAEKFIPPAPAGCAAWAKTLNDWAHANTVATQVIAKGDMPSAERKELRAFQSAMEALP